MSFQEEIIKTFVVGTKQHTIDFSAAPESLKDNFAQLHNTSSEELYLQVMAAASLYYHVNELTDDLCTRINDLPPLVEPGRADKLPACSKVSATHLSRILSENDLSGLLPEWLTAIASACKRVSEDSLPSLLDSCSKNSTYRKLIIGVIGERGNWLAKQNPEWSYAVTDYNHETWNSDNSDKRLHYLQHLRRLNPRPARELLISTWERESKADRELFIQALSIGLEPDDEPFLENVLDASTRSMRMSAAGLLARLPESAYSQRMLDRVRSFTVFKKRITGFDAITITPPNDLDKSMIRDGITPRPKFNCAEVGFGEKQWWIKQIIGTIAPHTWSQEWNVSPKRIIYSASYSDWKLPLIYGWIDAALKLYTPTSSNQEWVEELMDVLSDDKDFSSHASGNWDYLFRLLEKDKREYYIISIWQQSKQKTNLKPIILNMLKRHRYKWSQELSRVMLDQLSDYLKNNADTPSGEWKSVITLAGSYFDLSMIDAATTQLSDIFKAASDVHNQKRSHIPNHELKASEKKLKNIETFINQFLTVIRFHKEALEEINR